MTNLNIVTLTDIQYVLSFLNITAILILIFIVNIFHPMNRVM